METKICQACGMPFSGEYAEHVSPENGKYCKYCWENGQYVGAATVEEMIEICVPHMGMEPDAARAVLREQLPQLEHWKERE